MGWLITAVPPVVSSAWPTGSMAPSSTMIGHSTAS